VNRPEELFAAAPATVAGNQLTFLGEFWSFEFRRDRQRVIPSILAVAETRQPRHEVRQSCGLPMNYHDLLDRSVDNRAALTPPAGMYDVVSHVYVLPFCACCRAIRRVGFSAFRIFICCQADDCPNAYKLCCFLRL
jgi:hypothetical protein